MPHAIEVPPQTIDKWQQIVNLLAEIIRVPSALIMRVAPPNIEVLVSSHSRGNPYEPAEAAMLGTGLYCETVMQTREALLVHNAVEEEDWKSNPDIKLGMISYMGLPISWPDGEIFGTICVLDSKTNSYSETFLKLLVLCRDAMQADLQILMTLTSKLEAREARIQRLIDADIIGIFIWEIETQIIVEANDAFLRIVGYDREDLSARGLRWTNLTPPEWLERDLAQRLPELRRTGRLQPFEKEYLRKDGSRVPVLMGVVKLEDGANQAVAFMLDLTQLKLAETQARESERRYRESQSALAHVNRVTTMGQLTASISHELKQPIGASAMNADAGLRWLKANPPNLEEAHLAFARICKDAKLASEIINHIRGLFKNAPMSKEAVQINEAIREIITLTHGEILKHGIAVQLKLAENLPLVEGDRVQLQQAILNLIVNAIEAMSAVDEGPRELTISTGMDDANAVVVSVRDSGSGVAPENIERLFEAFCTTKASGMGMGLTICRSIVQAHGGTLRLCENEARGAIFQFTVPTRHQTQG